MACKIWNVKTRAIYNLARNLLIDPNSNVNTFEDVLNYFKTSEKYKDSITEREVIDSFVSVEEKTVVQSKEVINKKIGDVRKQARLMDRLDMFLHGTLISSTKNTTERSDAMKSMDAVFNKFKELAKKGTLTDADIDATADMVKSLPVNLNITEAEIESTFNQLIALKKQSQEQRDQEKVSKLSDKLGKLFKGEFKAQPKKTRIPPEENLKELKNVLEGLYKLAGANTEIDPSDIANIVEKLETIEDYYLEHYNTDGAASEEAIKNAIANLRELRSDMKLENTQQRIKKYNKDVDTLNRALNGEDVDITDLVVDNTGLPWKGKDNALTIAEHELQDAKDNLKALQSKIIFKAKVSQRIDQLEKSWGINLKNKGVEGMLTFYYTAISKGWNSIRALKFMLDNSAFFVQLAPLVFNDIASTPITTLKYMMGNKEIDPLAGLHRIRDVWVDAFFKIMINPEGKNSGTKWYNYRTSTKGSQAKTLYHEITKHELYNLMIEAGLKISRSRSLVDSEEYFKDSLVNNVPILGFLKDVSEDIMVSSLNMYRVLMFTQYHEMHPNLTLDQYKQAAEGINILSGTTNRWGQFLGPAAAILSAPRLMVSRIITSIAYPLAAITKIDIQKSKKSGSLKYRDEYSAFIARQTAGLFAGMGMIMLMSVAIGAAVGTDWKEKDFFRIRIDDKAYDITGGMGSIYRTLALMHLLTFGPPENASYQAKARINYLKSIQHEDALGALLGYGRTKLNPAITGPYQILTGKDFIGRPFADTETKSRLDATWRLVAPITVESIVDAFKTDDSFGGGAVDLALQIHGINVFQYDSEKSNTTVDQVINKLEYSPQISYPDGMSTRNGKEVKNSLQKEYLKNKYKEVWGDALGEYILANPDMTAQQLKNGWKPKADAVEREFIKKYGDDIKQLELK